MAILIDGNELFKCIAGHSYYSGDDILTRISLMQEGKLPKKKDIEPADVRPVIHATWRDYADKVDKRFNKHDYFCPVCNTRADAFVAGTEDWYCYFAPNFCPNCGADMRNNNEQ